MKIVFQMFSAVMWLDCVISSYTHHGFNNSPRQFNLGMPGSSDYANFEKVHRKRYSGFGKSKLMSGANDLLNSYFKIGSFPLHYGVAPPSEGRPRTKMVGEKSVNLKTQPTAGNAKPAKKVVQAEKPVHPPSANRAATSIRGAIPVRALSPIRALTPLRAAKANPPAQAAEAPVPVLVKESTKPAELQDSKPVKRPVIIIGHIRGGVGHHGPQHEQSLRRYAMAPAGKL